METDNYENPFAAECNQYAHKFDEAFDFENWDTTKLLIKECEDFIKQHPNDYKYAPIYYSLGTSYSDLMAHIPEYAADDVQEKILYYYRICFELLSDKRLDKPRYKPYVTGLKLPLLTNYANILDHCGRKISAIRYYRKALEINPNFKMAIGNVGVALLYYSMIVHDLGHRDYLNHFAYRYLKLALEDTNNEVHSKAQKHFQRIISGYDAQYVTEFLEKPLHINEYISVGLSRTKSPLHKLNILLNQSLDFIRHCFPAGITEIYGYLISGRAYPPDKLWRFLPCGGSCRICFIHLSFLSAD